jgi:hypothetical protein
MRSCKNLILISKSDLGWVFFKFEFKFENFRISNFDMKKLFGVFFGFEIIFKNQI